MPNVKSKRVSAVFSSHSKNIWELLFIRTTNNFVVVANILADDSGYPFAINAYGDALCAERKCVVVDK